MPMMRRILNADHGAAEKQLSDIVSPYDFLIKWGYLVMIFTRDPVNSR
jgi:hypothetical protein